jgi:DNA-binding response OmpR family regulator
LPSAGYRFQSILNPEKAIGIMLDNPPHLILMDIKMPTVSGLHLLQEIKKESYLKDIPVVMFTNMKTKEIVSKAIELGAAGYLVKPIQVSPLLSQIKKCLGSKSKPLSVEIPEYAVTAGVSTLRFQGVVVGIGEVKVQLNSDFFFPKGFNLKYESTVFEELGISNPILKLMRNEVSPKRRFKCQNEFMMIGPTNEELRRVRAWVNVRVGQKR